MSAHKWNAAELGPIQAKRLSRALSALRWERGSSVTVHGVHGDPSSEHRTRGTAMFAATAANPRADELYAEVGERFGWTATKATLPAVLEAIATATAEAIASAPVIDNRETPAVVAERAERIARSNAEALERAEAIDTVCAALEAKRPAGASAIILAELHSCTSDPMTDYHGHTIERTVAIGWRTGTRESFAQLRKAAAGFPETAHLGPDCDRWRVTANPEPGSEETRRHNLGGDYWGAAAVFPTEAEARAAAEATLADPEAQPGYTGAVGFAYFAARYGYTVSSESVEHRENYSMGAGNYLKAGHSDSDGWRVFSRDIGASGRLRLTTPTEDAIPGPVSAGDRAEASGPGWELVPATNKRGGFFLVVPAARVERERFEELRSSAKRVGGWYSRKWGRQPGGFGFDSSEAAEAWAGSAFGTENAPRTNDGTRPDPRGPRPLEDRPSLEPDRMDRLPFLALLSLLGQAPGWRVKFAGETEAIVKSGTLPSAVLHDNGGEVGILLVDDENGMGDFFPLLDGPYLVRQLAASIRRQAAGGAGRGGDAGAYCPGCDEPRDLPHLAACPELPAPAPEPDGDPVTAEREAEASRLEGMADRLAGEVERKRAPLTQNPTPRRLRIKDGQRADAADLEALERALRALADAIRRNRVPGELAAVRTKARAEEALHGYRRTPLLDRQRAALAQLVDSWAGAELREADAKRAEADRIRALEDAARFDTSPDFFPTPAAVADAVVDALGLNGSPLRILEPSAGIGHLAEAVAGPGRVVHAIERRADLADILRAKGWPVSCSDFLETNPAELGTFDRVAMNPPFTRGADAVHVRHAAKFLAPGGRLVSVTTPRSAETLAEELGGWVEPLPDGSFTGPGAFRNTGVSSALFVLDAPEVKP